VVGVAEARHGGADGNLSTARAVSAEVVHRHGVVPLGIDGGVLVVHALKRHEKSI
jgi:hypothetical protein